MGHRKGKRKETPLAAIWYFFHGKVRLYCAHRSAITDSISALFNRDRDLGCIIFPKYDNKTGSGPSNYS